MLLSSSTFASVAGMAVASATALTGLAVAVHAYVRRVRGPAAGRPPLEDARLYRLEQAVDAVAIEVERVSEGQRFLTKVHAARGPASGGVSGADPGRTSGRGRSAVCRRAACYDLAPPARGPGCPREACPRNPRS